MDTNTLHDCAHCQGSGTCKSGENQASCYVCAKRNELRLWLFKPKIYYGLSCGTCGGLGKTDSLTHRLQHRIQPSLAMAVIGISLSMIMVFGIGKSPYFHEILTFSSTLLGSIIGYYFSNNKQ